jgi:hypothetical protein
MLHSAPARFLTLSVALALAAVSGRAQSKPVATDPVDVVDTQSISVPAQGNILDALPTSLFKMGQSNYHGKRMGVIEIGNASVLRTPTSFQLNTQIGPVTISPETDHPDRVQISTQKKHYEGTLVRTPDGQGATAQTLNKKKTFTFHPETDKSNGQSVQGVAIDITGITPWAMHVHLVPIA